MDALTVVGAVVGIGSVVCGAAVAVATRITSAAGDVRALAERVEAVGARVDAVSLRVAAIETAAVQHAERAGREDAQIKGLDDEVEKLRKWVHDYQNIKGVVEHLVELRAEEREAERRR